MTTRSTEPTRVELTEPAKVGPDGFLTREWTAWEWRQGEKRLHATRPAAAEAHPLEAVLDAQIAEAGLLREQAVMAKVSLQKQLAEAGEGADALPTMEVVRRRSPKAAQVRDLIGHFQIAVDRVKEAEEAETKLRRERIELGKRHWLRDPFAEASRLGGFE